MDGFFGAGAVAIGYIPWRRPKVDTAPPDRSSLSDGRHTEASVDTDAG